MCLLRDVSCYPPPPHCPPPPFFPPENFRFLCIRRLITMVPGQKKLSLSDRYSPSHRLLRRTPVRVDGNLFPSRLDRPFLGPRLFRRHRDYADACPLKEFFCFADIISPFRRLVCKDMPSLNGRLGNLRHPSAFSLWASVRFFSPRSLRTRTSVFKHGV